MPTLGELLVAEGVCTQQQVDEAARCQVIFGGLLGSSLLDLGYIDEESLARVLAEHYQVPALAGAEIRPDQEALALLPAREASRLNLIPYRIEDGQIEVLCLDPFDRPAFEEFGRLAKLTPVPIIVPEARFSQLLLDFYGVERRQRFMAIQTRDFVAASFGTGPSSVSERPIGESDFDQLYRRRDGFPAVSSSSTPPMGIRTSQPASAPSPPTEPPPVPDGRAQRVGQVEESAITFDEAERLLSEVADRDTIARIVLRVARSDFKRALLFTVHQKVALGWDGLGDQLTPGLVQKLVIPLDVPSVFKTVVDSRSPFFGALANTPVNVKFLKEAGRLVPLSVLVVPVLVGGRVVNILYLDNGHRVHCQGDIGELLILAQRISRSYEELVAKTRAAFQRGQADAHGP